jgi:hypothetical protein
MSDPLEVVGKYLIGSILLGAEVVRVCGYDEWNDQYHLSIFEQVVEGGHITGYRGGNSKMVAPRDLLEEVIHSLESE